MIAMEKNNGHLLTVHRVLSVSPTLNLKRFSNNYLQFNWALKSLRSSSNTLTTFHLLRWIAVMWCYCLAFPRILRSMHRSCSLRLSVDNSWL